MRCAIVTNACGWGAIMGLNVLLPIYLQGAMGVSPSQAGLSLMGFMIALNTSAGLAGQVLGRVRHYKLLPTLMVLLAILAVNPCTACRADHTLLVRAVADCHWGRLRADSIAHFSGHAKCGCAA